jgi:hypothetical protein
LEGDFKVRAVNECGECVSSCTIKLPKQQQQQQLKQQQQQQTSQQQQQKEFHSYSHTMTQSSEIIKKEIVKKNQAPKFSTPVHGLMAEEGADVKLFGVLQGHPEPKVTWLHKGKPLLVGKDPAIKIETKNKMTILTIEKVT